MDADLKTYADLGLGAVSLLLWLRQGKVNRTQVETNRQLTTMVHDHETRLAALETREVKPKRKWYKRRTRKAGA